MSELELNRQIGTILPLPADTPPVDSAKSERSMTNLPLTLDPAVGPGVEQAERRSGLTIITFVMLIASKEITRKKSAIRFSNWLNLGEFAIMMAVNGVCGEVVVDVEVGLDT